MAVLQIRNRTRNGGIGAAAAIVCFEDAPDRPYLLSASHVLAPTMDAEKGDEIVAANAAGSISAGTVIAHLADWTGLIDGAGFPNPADAALAELIVDIDPEIAFSDLLGRSFAAGRPGSGINLRTLSASAAAGAVLHPSKSCHVAWEDPDTRDLLEFGMIEQVLAACRTGV